MALPGWIEASWIAETLRSSSDVYMAVNAAHILGIGLLVGAIIPLDLRLLSVGRKWPLQVLAPFLSQCAAWGLALAILTGAALWAVRPAEYLGNTAFVVKMLLLALALGLVGLQHLGRGWRGVLSEGTVSLPVRLLAGASLACWLSILLAGRWIAFL
ncbi:putative membrane protein [Hyphomonas neptunium ATCC 15444]|uniref:DUF6644 domain-containing protein n=2 Tax=Hyphomonas TaxID=85 RepID=A0A059FN53_9PROT|nr:MULTISPECIES: DUF6644 family protein [Hyphomonas]ABI76915.1 putative membrane protein [Hyphomonas neptunium ATCC 15444]KCZ91966.1 hypothetical protein HHI_12074 [Hyphomonas hirschiana VP5]